MDAVFFIKLIGIEKYKMMKLKQNLENGKQQKIEL